jgi:hypothetical protein
MSSLSRGWSRGGFLSPALSASGGLVLSGQGGASGDRHEGHEY